MEPMNYYILGVMFRHKDGSNHLDNLYLKDLPSRKKIIEMLNARGMDDNRYSIISFSRLTKEEYIAIAVDTSDEEDTPLHECGLTVRTQNILRRHDVTTLSRLLALTPAKLYCMRGVGKKMIQEIEACQERYEERPPSSRTTVSQ